MTMTDEKYIDITGFINQATDEVNIQIEHYQDQIYYLEEIRDKLVGAFNVMEEEIELS